LAKTEQKRHADCCSRQIVAECARQTSTQELFRFAKERRKSRIGKSPEKYLGTKDAQVSTTANFEYPIGRTPADHPARNAVSLISQLTRRSIQTRKHKYCSIHLVSHRVGGVVALFECLPKKMAMRHCPMFSV
jgi:hypothetical protein